MSVSGRAPLRAKAARKARIRATLAKLDELVATHPHLTSPENQERLVTHLDDAAHEKGDEDGGEKDSRR